MDESPHFEKLLDLLLEHKVEFIIVGGFAVVLRGYVRVTEDLDILIRSSAENVARLEEALSRFGEGWGKGLTLDDFPLEPGAVRIAEEDCPVDIFTLMGGMTYEQLAGESPEVSLMSPDKKARCLSRARLIQVKSGSMRGKDQIDVIELKRLGAE